MHHHSTARQTPCPTPQTRYVPHASGCNKSNQIESPPQIHYPPTSQAYWPFHKPGCRPNEFADAVEGADSKFAAWMRGHGKLAVLKVMMHTWVHALYPIT